MNKCLCVMLTCTKLSAVPGYPGTKPERGSSTYTRQHIFVPRLVPVLAKFLRNLFSATIQRQISIRCTINHSAFLFLLYLTLSNFFREETIQTF